MTQILQIRLGCGIELPIQYELQNNALAWAISSRAISVMPVQELHIYGQKLGAIVPLLPVSYLLLN